MKIIAVDNFARDSVPARLVAEGIYNNEEAIIMRNALIDKLCNKTGLWYYRIVSDDYRLSHGLEDII